MIVLVNPYLLRKNFLGISLWPFIILKKTELKLDNVFINHEKIHLRQQIEMLVIPFYIWYVMEYLFRMFQYKNRREAYRNISFEREAYANEKDLDYLKKRPFWRFLNYF
jgi:cytochrome bd-type quinol oxidase subunit 2